MRRPLLAVVHQASNERSLMSRLLALKFHVLLTTQKLSSNVARSRNGLMAYYSVATGAIGSVILEISYLHAHINRFLIQSEATRW